MVEVYQSDVVTSLGKLGRDNGLTATTCVVGLVVSFDIVVSLFMVRIYIDHSIKTINHVIM